MGLTIINHVFSHQSFPFVSLSPDCLIFPIETWLTNEYTRIPYSSTSIVLPSLSLPSHLHDQNPLLLKLTSQLIQLLRGCINTQHIKSTVSQSRHSPKLRLTRQNKPPQTTISLTIPNRLTGNSIIHLLSKRIPRDIQNPHADPVAYRIGLVQHVLENQRVRSRVIRAAGGWSSTLPTPTTFRPPTSTGGPCTGL